ncbi:MAG: hypothetical protein CMP47_09120 [Rickettsiales bacterium]|jgi:hypothetical protein|nr:hypothetical protein [Rickettsiales bacterium]
MKYMILILLALIMHGCGANQSPENLLIQSRMYTDSYYRYYDLNSSTNHDLYFLQTGTETSQTKLYLYKLKEEKVEALFSVGKPVKKQFFDILKSSPRLMFSDAARLVEVDKFEFNSSNCSEAFEMLNYINLPFDAEEITPLEIKFDAPSYIVQQRKGKEELMIETISTHTNSVSIIKELTAVNNILEGCIN